MGDKMRPPACAGGLDERVAGHIGHIGSSLCNQSTTWPVILQAHKRGRWCTVGKVVALGGSPVLATVVRRQHGTTDTVSMPELAVDYAERCGCAGWLYRNDRERSMRQIGLDLLRRDGWLQGDGELYVPLDAFEPVPWRRWAYVPDDRCVRLATPWSVAEPEADSDAEPEAQQLRLWAAA